MPFYIRVPSLIPPVHCITQTEEPTRFLAGLWNLSNGLANQVLEMANQAPLPEECRSQLLELIEHSPKGISQEEINHTLDQIDRCVERYLLSVKS